MILRSFESAANGMNALMDMNDNTANNLANVNTIGYKKGSLRFKDIMQSAVYSQQGSIIRNTDESNYLGSLSVGSASMQYTHDFSQGALTKTSNPYDVAIEGDGFFKVQDVIHLGVEARIGLGQRPLRGVEHYEPLAAGLLGRDVRVLRENPVLVYRVRGEQAAD